MSEKKQALEDVESAFVDYRVMQEGALQARESFIDSIVEARDAKASQQEIAECCAVPGDKHLSRQRVHQFLDERR